MENYFLFDMLEYSNIKSIIEKNEKTQYPDFENKLHIKSSRN